MTSNLGTWTKHDLEGHPCQIFRPCTRHPHDFCVLFLHNREGDVGHGHDPFERTVAAHGLTVFAPRAGPTWWTDRIARQFDTRFSPERYLWDCVLPVIREEMGTQTPRLGLLGVGMGGQAVLRMSYKYPDRFPVVAAISPAIDFQHALREGDEVLLELYGDPESARQDTATLQIHPLNWPRHQFFCCDPEDYRWFDSVDRLRMKLSSLGVPFPRNSK